MCKDERLSKEVGIPEIGPGDWEGPGSVEMTRRPKCSGVTWMKVAHLKGTEEDGVYTLL